MGFSNMGVGNMGFYNMGVGSMGYNNMGPNMMLYNNNMSMGYGAPMQPSNLGFMPNIPGYPAHAFGNPMGHHFNGYSMQGSQSYTGYPMRGGQFYPGHHMQGYQTGFGNPMQGQFQVPVPGPQAQPMFGANLQGGLKRPQAQSQGNNQAGAGAMNQSSGNLNQADNQPSQHQGNADNNMDVDK